MRSLTSEQPLFWSRGAWCEQLPEHDRAFQFGDGLFETMRCDARGQIPLWRLHRERLAEGLQRLDFPVDALNQVELSLAQLNLLRSAGLKLIVSRGSSQQGYAPAADSSVTLRWSAFAAPDWKHRQKPDGLKLGINPVRMAQQPLLAGLKHTNRLEQILARKAFQPDWDESVMLDTHEQVVEGTMSNLVWLTPEGAFTPPVDQAGVNGVIRRWLLEQQAIVEARCTLATLRQANGVVMINSMMGLVPVYQLEQILYERHNPCLNHLMTFQQSLEAMF